MCRKEQQVQASGPARSSEGLGWTPRVEEGGEAAGKKGFHVFQPSSTGREGGSTLEPGRCGLLEQAAGCALCCPLCCLLC